MSRTDAGLRPKVYPLLCDAVEVGARLGWRRAHKHVDNPTERAIREAIEDEVVNAIMDRFSVVDADDPP